MLLRWLFDKLNRVLVETFLGLIVSILLLIAGIVSLHYAVGSISSHGSNRSLCNCRCSRQLLVSLAPALRGEGRGEGIFTCVT